MIKSNFSLLDVLDESPVIDQTIQNAEHNHVKRLFGKKKSLKTGLSATWAEIDKVKAKREEIATKGSFDPVYGAE